MTKEQKNQLYEYEQKFPIGSKVYNRQNHQTAAVVNVSLNLLNGEAIIHVTGQVNPWKYKDLIRLIPAKEIRKRRETYGYLFGSTENGILTNPKIPMTYRSKTVLEECRDIIESNHFLTNCYSTDMPDDDKPYAHHIESKDMFIDFYKQIK